MKKALFIIFLALLFLNCNLINKKYIHKSLEGEWALIVGENEGSPFISSSSWERNQGFGIKGNQIEIFNGFSKTTQDSLTWEFIVDYRGNFTDYKISKDTLYIKNVFNGNWEFKWRIKEVSQDTLAFMAKDTLLLKYKRLTYNLIAEDDFDQIIFSRSGCFGLCPIFDVSIDKNNQAWFYGEGFVKPLGFYQSQIDSSKTNFIFDKFKKADIKNLSKTFTDNSRDGSTITTTFVKNGIIQKTISDVRRSGPKELSWAYVSIENLYKKIDFSQKINDNPYYQKLHYYSFYKDSLILELKKSESFYLWTELKKAQLIEATFDLKYELRFAPNHIYYPLSGAELTVRNAINQRKELGIGKIESDGQYFTFHFNNKSPQTYNLGYNFIQRNFKESDFIQIPKPFIISEPTPGFEP